MAAVWLFLRAVPWWVYLLLALLTAIGVQTVRLHHAQVQLEGSEATVAALQNAIQVQNQAELAYKAVQDAKLAAASSALDKAVKDGSRLRKTASDASKLIGKGVTCPKASEAVRNAL